MRDQVYAQIRGELKASSELDPGEASGIESEIVRHLRAAFVKASRASRPERAARLRDAWQSIADTLPAMRVSRQSSPFAIPAGWGRPLVEWLNGFERLVAGAANDAELLNQAEAMANKLPDLLTEMDIAAMAKVLESGMGRAVIQGVLDTMNRGKR